METLPLTEAKAKLSALVDLVADTNDRVTVTRHGRPAVVIMSTDDLESIEETLYWLATPDLAARLGQSQQALLAGDYSTTADDARARITALREQRTAHQQTA